MNGRWQHLFAVNATPAHVNQPIFSIRILQKNKIKMLPFHLSPVQQMNHTPNQQCKMDDINIK
jgi:hypothetical protein